MQPHRDLQRLQNVFPPQHPIVPPHVQKFDGENVRRPLHLFRTQQQRRAMLLLPPPLDRRRQRLNRSERSLAEHAQQIHVRVVGNIISRRRRPIKNRRQQIRSRRRPHPFDKLVNQFFRNHRDSRFLITAERPAATCTPATESSKPTATTPSAKTTKPSSAVSTTSTTAHVVQQHAP